MRRSTVVAVAVSALIGFGTVVGTAAAASGAGSSAVAPDKTVMTTVAAGAAVPTAFPPSSVPPLATGPALPTVAPPTSAWLATTTTLAPVTVPPVTAPPVTLAPITVPVVSPVTASSLPPNAASSFDGLAFLTEVYAAVSSDDPLSLLDVAEQRTIVGTPAELFVAHLLGVTITRQIDLGEPPEAYTVTAEGKAVRVCTAAGVCDVFGDFFAPTGLLESFSINGQPLTVGAGFRQVNVESLSVDSTLCLLLSDGALSCVLLLSSEGAATALTWGQSLFTAADGRQFPPDLARSVYTSSIADGGFGSGHLVIPGAPAEGEITLPIVSGMTGVPNVVTVAIRPVT